MNNIDFWIKYLGLLPPPEGGYYRESYRSPEVLTASTLLDRFEGDRHFSTAIYFLLRSEDRSVFHRIKSDELWHFYQGSTLLIYVLHDNKLHIHRLGSDLDKGDSLQVVIPANCWFGAHVENSNSFSLCGCTVAPGFDFRDFEMADRGKLVNDFPHYSDVIKRLT
jgi:uncharacterized protein